MDNFEKKLKTAFLTEAAQVLAELECHVLSLEKSVKLGAPCPDEVHDEIFRFAHNLKGTAAASGFEGLAEFVHEIESLVQVIRTQSPNGQSVALLMRGLDHFKECVGILTADLGASLDHQASVIEIQTFLSNSAPPSPSDPVSRAVPPLAVVPPTAAVQGASTSETSVRVNLHRLDQLINLIGEMTIAQSKLAQQTELSIMSQSFLRELKKITTEVQRHSMGLRMSPIKPIFNSMNRIVRDTSSAVGKEVDLEISGEGTELDKTVLEKISDPLMHLLRNAVDHGIETAHQRELLGKPARGKIRLSAHQNGDQIIIEVKDDGQGLDAEALIEKAMQKGLIAKDAVLSEAEAFALIYLPNFSTKSEVSGISGRGVGMDVVKTNIQKLQGRIEISSTRGVGTTFKIELPLSLAIMDGVLIKVEGQTFVVPFGHYSESIRVSGESSLVIDSQTGQRSIFIRGIQIPVFRLSTLLGMGGSERQVNDQVGIIVKNAMNRLVCVLADDVMDSQNVVMKQLDPEIQELPWILGGAILGSGRPSLILDMNQVLEAVW